MRNGNGTFGKGNQAAVKDITKEQARKIVNDELHLIAKLIADTPNSELEKIIEENSGSMSLLANKMIKQIKKGDMKATQWFVEMIVGKAKQQVEHSAPEGKTFNLGYARNK